MFKNTAKLCNANQYGYMKKTTNMVLFRTIELLMLYLHHIYGTYYMKNYFLSTIETDIVIGTTDLKDSIGRYLQTNACTILICYSGYAIASINSQKQIVRKGDVILLFEDITFITLKTSTSFSVYFITVAQKVMEDVFYKLTSISFWDFLNLHPILHTTKEQWEQIYIWYKQIQWIMQLGISKYIPILISNSIYNLFTGIDCELKCLTQKYEQTKKGHTWMLLGRFSSLVLQNCQTNREVSFYADKLCISTDYLYKLTCEFIKQSPKEFINSLVISKINTYLSTTDLSVKNIAIEMNFEDASYMCRFFRRLTGLSPIEYRKRNSTI